MPESSGGRPNLEPCETFRIGGDLAAACLDAAHTAMTSVPKELTAGDGYPRQAALYLGATDEIVTITQHGNHNWASYMVSYSLARGNLVTNVWVTPGYNMPGTTSTVESASIEIVNLDANATFNLADDDLRQTTIEATRKLEVAVRSPLSTPMDFEQATRVRQDRKTGAIEGQESREAWEIVERVYNHLIELAFEAGDSNSPLIHTAFPDIVDTVADLPIDYVTAVRDECEDVPYRNLAIVFRECPFPIPEDTYLHVGILKRLDKPEETHVAYYAVSSKDEDKSTSPYVLLSPTQRKAVYEALGRQLTVNNFEGRTEIIPEDGDGTTEA